MPKGGRRSRTFEGVKFRCKQPGTWIGVLVLGSDDTERLTIESGRRGWTWSADSFAMSMRTVHPTMEAAARDGVQRVRSILKSNSFGARDSVQQKRTEDDRG